MFEDKTKRVIAEEWLKLIYVRLEQLNESYMRMREGCVDLIEFIPLVNQKETLQQVQYKNAGFIISYIKLILSSAEAIFNPKDYEELSARVDFLDSLHTDGINKGGIKIKVFELKRSDVTNTQTFTLTSHFIILIKHIDKLYAKLVSNIQEILFLDGNIKNVVKK